MFRIPRKEKELLEPIERLDLRFSDAGVDPARAWASLQGDELEFIAREIARCVTSPRYFLENYFVIRTKRGRLRTLYPLFDSQEIIFARYEAQYERKGPIRLIALKSRQQGITSWGVGILSWMAMLHPNMYVLAMSDEEVRVDVNYSMAEIAHGLLPWWMRPEKRYAEKGEVLGFDRLRATDRQTSPGLGSLIWFESANQPSGAAYSKSLYAAQLSEVARYRKASSITEGVFGGLVNYPRSFGLMESVARGRKGAFYKLCKAAHAGELDWEFVFIEWFREKGYTMTVPEGFTETDDEQQLVEKVKADSGYQLTKGQLQFRRGKMAEMLAAEGDYDRWHQEFPANWVEAFIATGRSAFNKAQLLKMLQNFAKAPLWRGEIYLDDDNQTPRLSQRSDGRLWIWEKARKDKNYYIGADPSMGLEHGDPACAQVYLAPDDPRQPLRQVARWRGFIAPNHLARVIAAMGYLYNIAEVAPECNTITTVASDLVRVLNYPRWYRDMREDKARNPFLNYIGWMTTWRSRNLLISRFAEAIDQWTVLIRCEEDIDELLNFVETEEGSGKFEARKGYNDDTVIANMITYYVACRLRPRRDGMVGVGDEEDTYKPGQTKQNTDWSPVWDIDQPQEGEVTFDML